MTAAFPLQIKSNRSNRLRAFTLVELMVAVTGGLFISIIVFAMARQGTRFYQQETRIAEATLGATIGMQRLRADIGRAGYMASPYIATDPNLCTPVGALALVPLLSQLRSIQISQDATVASNADLTAAGITPDKIQLAGAYQNADRFLAGYLPPAGGANVAIPLQPGIGAMVRYGYNGPSSTATTNAALLNSLFPAGRALRLVNQYGKVAYALIASTTTTGGPAIILDSRITLPLGGGGSNVCQFAGVGVELNVVNFYQYRIADVKNSPIYGPLFSQLYASTANPWDVNRTELIREELDPTQATPTPFTVSGTVVAPEIIAEYAVDLKFEVTFASPWPPGNLTQLFTTPDAAGDTVYSIAGLSTTPSALPQRVRSVRVRLSVRSREADRAATISGTGLYRIGITPATGPKMFARVRTLQADVAVPNHFGVTWQ